MTNKAAPISSIHILKRVQKSILSSDYCIPNDDDETSSTDIEDDSISTNTQSVSSVREISKQRKCVAEHAIKLVISVVSNIWL